MQFYYTGGEVESSTPANIDQAQLERELELDLETARMDENIDTSVSA